MARTLSQAGIRLIQSFEGCRLTAYKPVATETYFTIGYGHYGSDVLEGMTITQAQADAMLAADVAQYAGYVNNPAYVPITNTLNQNQFDALVSFCYNCGAGNLKALCNGRTVTEMGDHILKYNKAGGRELAGLTRRREAERALFMKPAAATDTTIKEEEAMTAAEKQAFEALQETVKRQAEALDKLEQRDGMPEIPAWALPACEAAKAAGLVDTTAGRSYDFYSLLTVLHRAGYMNGVSK